MTSLRGIEPLTSGNSIIKISQNSTQKILAKYFKTKYLNFNTQPGSSTKQYTLVPVKYNIRLTAYKVYIYKKKKKQHFIEMLTIIQVITLKTVYIGYHLDLDS